jgi:hypothetical protein
MIAFAFCICDLGGQIVAKSATECNLWLNSRQLAAVEIKVGGVFGRSILVGGNYWAKAASSNFGGVSSDQWKRVYLF